MEVVFKKLIANMISVNQKEQDDDIEPFEIDPWASNLIFNGKNISNSVNLQLEIKWFKSMWVIKHTQSSSLWVCLVVVTGRNS